MAPSVATMVTDKNEHIFLDSGKCDEKPVPRSIKTIRAAIEFSHRYTEDREIRLHDPEAIKIHADRVRDLLSKVRTLHKESPYKSDADLERETEPLPASIAAAEALLEFTQNLIDSGGDPQTKLNELKAIEDKVAQAAAGERTHPPKRAIHKDLSFSADFRRLTKAMTDLTGALEAQMVSFQCEPAIIRISRYDD